MEDTKKGVLRIPEEHKKDIEIELDQIDTGGHTISNEEVNKRAKQWIG